MAFQAEASVTWHFWTFVLNRIEIHRAVASLAASAYQASQFRLLLALFPSDPETGICRLLIQCEDGAIGARD